MLRQQRHGSWTASSQDELKVGRHTVRLKRSLGEGGFAFIHLVEVSASVLLSWLFFRNTAAEAVELSCSPAAPTFYSSLLVFLGGGDCLSLLRSGSEGALREGRFTKPLFFSQGVGTRAHHA